MTRRIILSLLTLMLAICIGLSLLAVLIALVLLTTPGFHPLFVSVTSNLFLSG